MSNYITEAFKQLNLLEDANDVMLDASGIEELRSFLDDAAVDPDEEMPMDIFDLEAEAQEDLKKSYEGKVILECAVCHSHVFEDKDNISMDEEGLACPELECPYCMSNEGYYILGEVAPFNQEKADEFVAEAEGEDLPDVDIEGAVDDIDEEDLDEAYDPNGKGKGTTYDPNGKSKGTAYDPNGKSDGDAYRVDEEFKLDGVEELYDNDEIRGVEELEGSEKMEGSDAIRGDKYKAPINEDLEGLSSKELVKLFLKYHEDYDNYKNNEAGFNRMYNILSKYGNIDEEVDTVFLRAPYSEQVEMVNLIAPKDLSESYRKKHKASINESRKSRKRNKRNLKESEGNSLPEETVRNLENQLKNILPKIFKGYHDMSITANRLGEVRLDVYCNEADASAIDDVSKQDMWAKRIGKALKDWSVASLAFKSTGRGKVDGFTFKLRPRFKVINVNESIEDVSVTTEDETMTMTTKDDGGVVIETVPKEADMGFDTDGDFEEPSGEEMIVPIDDESSEIIDASIDALDDEDEEEFDTLKDETEEAPEEEFEDIEEFDEESFDNLGESYLRNCYENVKSFKTSKVSSKGNKLFIEGVIGFDSGNSKKTNFIFEAVKTSDGNYKLEGYNKQISRGKKTFKLSGSVNNKKFISETLNYNYRSRNELNESVRVYGTIRRK